VRDVAVIGLKDDDLGRKVHAVVEADDDNDPALIDHLLDRCREQLLQYKVPRTLEIVTALPRNEAGKIRRSQLRDERGG